MYKTLVLLCSSRLLAISKRIIFSLDANQHLYNARFFYLRGKALFFKKVSPGSKIKNTSEHTFAIYLCLVSAIIIYLVLLRKTYLLCHRINLGQGLESLDWPSNQRPPVFGMTNRYRWLTTKITVVKEDDPCCDVVSQKDSRWAYTSCNSVARLSWQLTRISTIS